MNIFTRLWRHGFKASSVPEESKVFRDFPLHRLNPYPVETAVEGQYLANVAAVGLAFCRELADGKRAMKMGWPDYATRELAVLESVYWKMLRKAAVQHDFDTTFVRGLAEMYVNRLANSAEAHLEFMKQEHTVSYMSVDFANTIGYGGGLSAALSFAERTAWLG